MVTLIKEIGSDALFALQRTVEGEELERVRRFYRHCAENDLAVCVAQTDVKGDRSKGPTSRTIPTCTCGSSSSDSEGIVVRGAKVHTSVTANSNEIIVLPTRAMGPDDADYAVSFAVPAATGLTLYVSSYAAGDRNSFEFPLSSRHKMLETLTVFDDVFVPWERVFVCRQPELAGPLALTFVEYHRFTAVSYKLPLLDALVGRGRRDRGDERRHPGRSHPRQAHPAHHLRRDRARAHRDGRARAAGSARTASPTPIPMTTNMAKYTFATGYHEAVELVQDCAGGLLVTGPGGEDWDNPEIRPVLEKYFRAASARPRSGCG